MPKQQKTAEIKVRCTEEEKAALFKTAERLDTTPSALLRALMTLDVRTLADLTDANAEGAQRFVVFDKETYPRLRYQLRMWGYHYDHCLHALNIIASRGYLPRDETRAYLDEAMDHLRKVDNARESLFEMVTMLLKVPGIQLDKPRNKSGE